MYYMYMDGAAISSDRVVVFIPPPPPLPPSLALFVCLSPPHCILFSPFLGGSSKDGLVGIEEEEDDDLRCDY